MSFDLITIGESLIELSTNKKLGDSDYLQKYYGGDSLVVALAAKRLNSKVGFITCLGDDSFKDFLLDSWKNEGLDTSFVRVVNDKNGVYMVSRTAELCKEFIYYRNKIAPAKLSIEDIDNNYIKSARIIYASGVTQSLSMTSREAVSKAFKIAKENGIITAYDPNYSPLITTIENIKEYFKEIFPLTDILFMSIKHDTQYLFDISSIENFVKFLTDNGVQTIVLKSATDKGYYIYNNGNKNFVRFYTENIVDTTSSSDAFNGAFLHATAQGYNALEAAKIASIDAGLQAQNIGAVKSVPYYDEVYKIYNSEVF